MAFSPEALMKALRTDIGRTKQPTDASSSSHVAAFLLQQNLVKKFTSPTSSAQAEENAIIKFKEVNNRVNRWVEIVDESVVSNIMARSKKLFHRQCLDTEGAPVLTLAKAFNVGMVGPGASIGMTANNFVDKLFNSTLTCTHPILYSYYVQAIANCKPWRKAEVFRARIYGKYRVVKGNNMFFVPKETIIARPAATEPTLNMFGQKGYGNLIEDILAKEHDIDLSVQPNINKWFAKSGSLNGKVATIDMSSASDTIGCRYIRSQFPDAVYKDLMLLRSPVSIAKGKEIPLRMISTMGNGFTFPLETWVFANLVLATLIELNQPIFDVYGKRTYSVFGDDIVCPTAIYDVLCKVLERAGFTVNKAKSFSTGEFRESCGGDYWKGVNVRAVYLKEYTHETHGYGLLNRLTEWSGVHKIPLPNTTKYLLSLVQFRPIPFYEEDTRGIKVPQSRLTKRKLSKSGNWIYHSVERVVKSVTPEPLTIERYYHAFHVALLHGSYKNGRITPRELPGEAVYKVVKRSAPISWDFSPNARLTTEERRNAFELNFPIRKA